MLQNILKVPFTQRWALLLYAEVGIATLRRGGHCYFESWRGKTFNANDHMRNAFKLYCNSANM